MPGFLYYIPNGHAGLTIADLAALGLGYAFDAGLSIRGCAHGPDGSSGVIVADARRVPSDQVGFYPERQTWRLICNLQFAICNLKSRPHVGFYPDSPPGPADLARAEQLDGHEVQLLDGGRWLVPVARGWLEQDGELRWYHTLPRKMDLDDAGQWVRSGVLPRYAALWDLAVRWDEARDAAIMAALNPEIPTSPNPQTITFDFSDIPDAAVQALAANYAIGRTEAAMLGLFTPAAAREVLDALTDYPTRLAWMQKKSAVDDAGLGSSAGPGDSTPGTAPR